MIDNYRVDRRSTDKRSKIDCGISAQHVLYCFFLSFCYAPKDLVHFSYIYHSKKPSFNEKVTIYFLSLVFSDLSTATSANRQKNWPTHKHRCVPLRKIPFINATQPFYGCQRNTRKKYYCVG